MKIILAILLLPLGAQAFTLSDCDKPGFTCNFKEKPETLDLRDGDLMLSHRVLVAGVFTGGFDFTYHTDPASGEKFAWGIRVFNNEGQVEREFSNDNPQPCETSNQPNRIKVALIDQVGVDLGHPDFKGKLWFNDRLLPGMADACVGISIDDWTTHRHILSPKFLRDGTLGTDHATMVASIAAQGLDKIALIPVGGNVKMAKFYPPALELLKREQVRFINISMAFEVLPKGYSGAYSDVDRWQETKDGMQSLVTELPKALFVIGSGNGPFLLPLNIGTNIDRTRMWPAAFTNYNIMSVGAVTTDEIVTANLPTYRKTSFSNYGLIGVDILAPGQNLLGAQAGGGHRTGSGTSYAAPYVMNQVVRIAELLPDLDILAIKELVLKTAYIPDLDVAMAFHIGDIPMLDDLAANPKLLAVRSGGIIFPERLLTAVKMLSADRTLSIEEAALRAHAKVLAPGEIFESAKLVRFWQDRGIMKAPVPWLNVATAMDINGRADGTTLTN